MPDHRSSLQAQSPLADAQNSVEKAGRAANQASANPSRETFMQAENALSHATRAVSQADDENGQALQQVDQQLSDVNAKLEHAKHEDPFDEQNHLPV